MIVECVGDAFTYRWPGGEIRLEPGKPVELPDERAKRLLAKAPGKVRVFLGHIQPGNRITWTRGDGTTLSGLVDDIHVDESGTRWAFVTIGEGWSAVNTKFATLQQNQGTAERAG